MILELVVILEGIVLGFLLFKLFLDEGDIEILHSLLWKQQDTIYFLKRKIAELYNEIGKEYDEEVMVWQKQRQK